MQTPSRPAHLRPDPGLPRHVASVVRALGVGGAVVAVVIIITSLAPAPARAHGPALSALGVAVVPPASPASPDAAAAAPLPAPYPDVVRMNFGLALANDDGTYSYACPSWWNDVDAAPVVGLPDRSVILTLGRGEAFVSTDRGCTFSVASWPDDDDAAPDARFALISDGEVLVVARTAAGGGVYRVDRGATPTPALRRLYTVDFHPDSGVAWTDPAGDSQLALAGARPTPTVALLDPDQPNSPLAWRSHPFAPGASSEFLSLNATSGDAILWVSTVEAGARRLYWGQPIGVAPTWQPVPGQWQRIQGPVKLGERWLASVDGHLGTLAGADLQAPGPEASAATFTIGEPVDWTCLQALAGQVYACTLPALLNLTDAKGSDEHWPASTPVFQIWQLAGPSPRCGAPGEPSPCQGDWVHFGAEAGLVDRQPDTTPHPPQPIPGLGPSSVGGQGCQGGDGGANDWLAWVLFVVASCHRPERSRRALPSS